MWSCDQLFYVSGQLKSLQCMLFLNFIIYTYVYIYYPLSCFTTRIWNIQTIWTLVKKTFSQLQQLSIQVLYKSIDLTWLLMPHLHYSKSYWWTESAAWTCLIHNAWLWLGQTCKLVFRKILDTFSLNHNMHSCWNLLFLIANSNLFLVTWHYIMHIHFSSYHIY